MKTSALLFGALVGDALAVANKWNPEGFDWASQKTRNDVAWLKNSGAPVTKQLAVQDSNQTTNASVTDVTFQSRAFLDTSLGVTLRAIGWNGAAKSTVSTAGTVLGCWDLAESELQGKATTPKSRASCAIGVGCALWGFGSTVKDYLNTLDAVEDVAAIQGIELPQLDAPDLGADFLESIDLDVFGRKKRALMRRGLHERGYSSDHHHVAQLLHNHHMSRALRDGGFGDGEFLGYAHEDHQLSKRDATHPLAARFKVDHPKKGPMVLATRHANTTFHMTAEPYVRNDGSHKARRWEEQLQKEVLENRVTEARFDTDAIKSAPADLDIDKNKAFEDAEDGMHCVLGGDDWNFSDVFDIQGYDNTNRGTYNYATIGIFEDQSGDADIEQMQPQPPVSGGDCS